MPIRFVHAHRILRRWSTTTALLLLAILNLSQSRSCCAQRLSYRPDVGQVHEYGVEFRLQSKDSPAKEFRRRNRIRFEILESDLDGWAAAYTTYPVGAPTSRPVIRSRENPFQSRPGGPPRASIPGQPAIIQQQFARAEEAREKAWQRMLAIREREQERYDLYPGLYQRCEGKIKVGSDGEILSDSSNTDLPMLAGALIAAPLVRLPKDGNVSGTASYRNVLEVTGQASDTGRDVQTKYSLLVTHRPDTSRSSGTGDDLIRYVRDTELSGGVNSDFEFGMSGSGEFSFSLSQGMPESGTLLIQSAGLSWDGDGIQHVLRISFQRLNKWSGPLFDIQMLPTTKALSKESMPRISAAEQNQIRKLVSGKGETRGSTRNMASLRAPLPLDSPLELGLRKLAATYDSDSEPSRSSGESSKQRERRGDAVEAQRILARWKNVRDAASGVPRVWSDVSGAFRLSASLLGRSDTDVILLRTEDRKKVRVPLEKLSEEDREIAMTFGRTAASMRE